MFFLQEYKVIFAFYFFFFFFVDSVLYFQELNVTVEVGTTFDQLQKWISSDEKGKTVDPGNLKLCYNSFMEKAEAKEKEQEREEARKVLSLSFRTVFQFLCLIKRSSFSEDVTRPLFEIYCEIWFHQLSRIHSGQ